MNSELGIRNSELGKCHPERNAVRRGVEGSIRLVGALVALVMTFLTACTDYQEEFDNNFAALEYGDIENPELSSGVDPGSSGGSTIASSASVSSGADPLSSGTVPASSGAEPLSSGTVPTSSGDIQSSSSSEDDNPSSSSVPTSSGTEPQSSGTEPASSSGEPPRSSAESSSSKGYGEVWVCSKIYKTVIIGEQTWMAENMACETNGSYCYDDNDQNCEKYGRLYNWEAAKTICPDGWHLPDSSEWQTLFDAVGGQENAGKVLKSIDGNGSNGVEFNALPAGYWSFTDKEYKELGFLAEFWVNDGNGVTIVHLVSSIEEAFWYNQSNPEDAYSVRCIKGAKPSSSSSVQSSSSSAKSSSSVVSSSSITVSSSSVEIVKDRAGNEYPVVQIGDQYWMAENLNYKTEGSACYDDQESKCDLYGRLYTWEAAMTACPEGYKLPSRDDYSILWNYANQIKGDLKVQDVLWENGTWDSRANNMTGFSAYPGGLWKGSYDRWLMDAFFWTSTPGEVYPTTQARSLHMNEQNAYLGQDDPKTYMMSVRCIKE